MEINDDEAGGHVDAGEQTLSGEEALILCRSRHSYDEYGDGDRYRAANQRLVLGAIAKKILSADPATMANTISALSQYITTDFKVGDIVALATSMQGIDPSKDIYSAMEPTISEYKNDTWYEQLDVAAWNTMMGRVREGLPPTEVDEVDELNGTVLASVGDGAGAASDREGVQGANGTQRQTFGETRTGIVTIKNGNGINGVAPRPWSASSRSATPPTPRTPTASAMRRRWSSSTRPTSAFTPRSSSMPSVAGAPCRTPTASTFTTATSSS